MTQHRVIFAEGAQSLLHVPVDRRGRAVRVASATYSIVDLRKTEESSDRTIASGSATIAATSTALTAAAGPSSTDGFLVPVTSATGITAGHFYLLSAADGRSELFQVRAVSNNNVYATHELVGDYTTTDSVVAIEMSASFPSGEAADELELQDGAGPYQVTWEYTIEDQLYLVPEIVWLTRYSVQPFITEADVIVAYPTLGSLARRRVTIADAIAAATQDYVAEAESAGKDPTLYRATHLAKVAVRERAIGYVLGWCGKDNEAAKHDEAFMRYVNQMFVGVPKTGSVTVDRDDNVAVAGGDQRQQSRFLRRS